MKERLATIRTLQQQAIYPLDPVGGVRALSQLAHVEVPWLTERLEEMLLKIRELEGNFND